MAGGQGTWGNTANGKVGGSSGGGAGWGNTANGPAGGWGPGFGGGGASSGNSGGWGPGFGGGGNAAAPAKKSPGGLLGFAENLGKTVAHPFQQAGHYIAQQGENVGTGLYGIGTGIYTLAKSEGQTLVHDFQGRNNKLNAKEWSDLLHGHIGRMFNEAATVKGANSPEAQLSNVVKASTVSYPGQVANVIEHPQKNLFQDVVTLAPLAGGAAGAVGRASDAVTAARAGETAANIARAAVHGTEPGVRTLNIPGNRLVAPLTAEGERAIGPDANVPTTTQVQLNQGRSYLSRYGAKAHDLVAQRALNQIPTTGRAGVVGRYALMRGAKSLEENANATANVRDVAVGDLQHAKVDAGLTSQEASLATVLHAGNVLPNEMARAWRQGAAEGVVRIPQEDGTLAISKVTPQDRERMLAMANVADGLAAKKALAFGPDGNVQVNRDQFPLLAARSELEQHASDIRNQAILATNPSVTPEGLQGRQNLVARVAGLNTPARPAEPPPTAGIIRQRARVERLQQLHDRGLARATANAQEGAATLEPAPSPQELAGAGRRLARLEAQHNAALDNLANGMFGPIDKGEVARRNLENARALRQQSGVTRNGNASGASGRKSVFRPTLTQERRVAAERAAQDAIAANPTHPASVAWQQRLDEIAQLRSGLNPEFGEQTTRAQLGKEPVAAAVGTKVVAPRQVAGAAGSARAERIGGALSVEKDRLQSMKAARARKVKLVNPAGAPGGRQGRAFVSLKPYEKQGPLSRFGRSNEGSVPQTKGIPLGKHATGEGLALGHIPENASREVAGGLRVANRVRNTNDLRGAVAAHGHDVRQTADDWLVAKDLPSRVQSLPEEMKVLLGKLRDTSLGPQEEHAIVGKWNEWVRDNLVNRHAGEQVGEAAPEGWTWVHKSLVPDSLRHNAQSRGWIEKQFAKLSTGVSFLTVYAKPGHIPQRLTTNAAFNAIHGSLNPVDIFKTRAMLKELSPRDRERLAAATGTHGYQSLPTEGTGLIARRAQAGANFYAKHIDAFFRQNAARYELAKVGYDSPAKISKALDAVEHGAKLPGHELMKINGALRRANRAAGDYETNALEKRTIQRFLWFYGFSKAATRFAGHTVTEHPGKAAILGTLGTQGNQEARKVLGPIPSFEGGLTPITGGRYPMTVDLSTLVPTGSVAREAEAFQHPLGQDGIQAFLNPVLAGTQAVFQGKGASGFGSQALGPTPELQAFKALVSPRKTGGSNLFPTSSQYLFGRTAESVLARALVGAALTPRRVNKSKLNQYAAREHQKKRTITVWSRP